MIKISYLNLHSYGLLKSLCAVKELDYNECQTKLSDESGAMMLTETELQNVGMPSYWINELKTWCQG